MLAPLLATGGYLAPRKLITATRRRDRPFRTLREMLGKIRAPLPTNVMLISGRKARHAQMQMH